MATLCYILLCPRSNWRYDLNLRMGNFRVMVLLAAEIIMMVDTKKWIHLEKKKLLSLNV